MITDEEISLVRESVTMADVCGMYGIPVTKTGFCSCPFHGADKHPSMKVYPGNRGFHCFTCHIGGDIFDFVRKEEGLGFEDSVRKVGAYFGIPLSDPKKRMSDEEIERLKRLSNQRKMERLQKEIEKKKHRNRLLELSVKIRECEYRMIDADPMSARYALMLAEKQKLEAQWDEEFERLEK